MTPAIGNVSQITWLDTDLAFRRRDMAKTTTDAIPHPPPPAMQHPTPIFKINFVSIICNMWRGTKKIQQYFINCIYSYFSQLCRVLFLSWLTSFRASCIISFISRSPYSLCKWSWFEIHSHFFSNSQESFVFLKWRIFSPQV